MRCSKVRTGAREREREDCEGDDISHWICLDIVLLINTFLN